MAGVTKWTRHGYAATSRLSGQRHGMRLYLLSFPVTGTAGGCLLFSPITETALMPPPIWPAGRCRGDMGTGTPWTVSLSVPGPVSVPAPSVDRLPPVLRRSMPRIGDGGYFVEVVPGCMRADRRRSSLSIVPVDRAGLAPGPVARVLHAIELPVIANRCSPQPAPSSVSIPWQAMIHS